MIDEIDDLIQQRDNAHSDNTALRARLAELAIDLEGAHNALLKYAVIFNDIHGYLNQFKLGESDGIVERVALLGERVKVLDFLEKCSQIKTVTIESGVNHVGQYQVMVSRLDGEFENLTTCAETLPVAIVEFSKKLRAD